MNTNKSKIFALFFILALITMNNTLPLMAAPYILGELGGSNDIGFYAVTFYSIGNALGVPLGRLCIGRMLPANFFLFMLSCSASLAFLGAFAPDYPYFLALRLLQGVAAGTLFPMITMVFSQLTTKEDADRLSYTVVTIFTVAPSVGAGLGGWIAYDYHWQWLFMANVLLFLASALFLKLQLPKLIFEKTPFDPVGYIVYILSITSISLAITMGQQLDWFRSDLINALFFVGILSLFFFIPWELSHPHPILDFRLLKNFVFSFALFNLAILFSAYFGMVILLAFWLNLWVNYTPLWIGLILGTMAIAGFFPRLLFYKGYERSDTRIPLVISIALLALSTFHTIYFNVDIDFPRIAISRVVAGFGLAFFLAPLYRLCFHTFPSVHLLPVINFFQLTRVLSGGLGAAFYITLWQRRQAFFHDRLGSQLTPFSPNTHHYYTAASELPPPGLPTPTSATAELADLLDRQSTALALDDCFYLMTLLLCSLFVFLLFTYRRSGFTPPRP
jgi:DHA2 family multidrug resistance protein